MFEVSINEVSQHGLVTTEKLARLEEEEYRFSEDDLRWLRAVRKTRALCMSLWSPAFGLLYCKYVEDEDSPIPR